MGVPAGDIEVVVFHGDDEPEVTAAAAAGRARRRRILPPVAVVLALLVVLGGPVAVQQPVHEATEAAAPCPEQNQRLWCSFVTGSECCRSGRGDQLEAPALPARQGQNLVALAPAGERPR